MKVFSIGGSVVAENLERIDELAEALERDEQVIVVTGAGRLNEYQKASSGNEGERDLIGIKATRLHAQTLLTEMKDTNKVVPETPQEIQQLASDGKNVVTGGLVPGYSTDAVAATVAELLDAELIIPTTVDGVYTADPNKEDAEKLDEVTPSRLRELISGNSEAGNYALIDEVAVTIIERSEIPTKIIEGSFENIADPENADGTEIVFK